MLRIVLPFPLLQSLSKLHFYVKKKPLTLVNGFLCSGDWTRTSDLRVMSPTSYLLLYPAMWTANIQWFICLIKTSRKNYLGCRLSLLSLKCLPSGINNSMDALNNFFTKSYPLYRMANVYSAHWWRSFSGLLFQDFFRIDILDMPSLLLQESTMIKRQKER